MFYLMNLKKNCGLTEFRFKFFLDSFAEEGYVKITKENITDWGEFQLLQLGEKYVNEYVPNEYTDINYNNFWDFLESR